MINFNGDRLGQSIAKTESSTLDCESMLCVWLDFWLTKTAIYLLSVVLFCDIRHIKRSKCCDVLFNFISSAFGPISWLYGGARHRLPNYILSKYARQTKSRLKCDNHDDCTFGWAIFLSVALLISKSNFPLFTDCENGSLILVTKNSVWRTRYSHRNSVLLRIWVQSMKKQPLRCQFDNNVDFVLKHLKHTTNLQITNSKQ